jgi:molybdopterin converting factor subunit 1
MNADSIDVKVLYFGAAAEIAGRREEQFSLPLAATAQTAFSYILTAHPQLKERWENSLLLAVNQEYAAADLVLQHADELAIIPPVSGG